MRLYTSSSFVNNADILSIWVNVKAQIKIAITMANTREM